MQKSEAWHVKIKVIKWVLYNIIWHKECKKKEGLIYTPGPWEILFRHSFWESYHENRIKTREKNKFSFFVFEGFPGSDQ